MELMRHEESSSYDEHDDCPSPQGTQNLCFTRKLYDILSDEHNHHIIKWHDDGQAFEVLDPKQLEKEVLPRYFRHARFQSLVRQLNFYSFKKVGKERSSWIYTHECFRRGHPELLLSLKRKTNCGGNSHYIHHLNIPENQIQQVLHGKDPFGGDLPHHDDDEHQHHPHHSPNAEGGGQHGLSHSNTKLHRQAVQYNIPSPNAQAVSSSMLHMENHPGKIYHHVPLRQLQHHQQHQQRNKYIPLCSLQLEDPPAPVTTAATVTKEAHYILPHNYCEASQRALMDAFVNKYFLALPCAALAAGSSSSEDSSIFHNASISSLDGTDSMAASVVMSDNQSDCDDNCSRTSRCSSSSSHSNYSYSHYDSAVSSYHLCVGEIQHCLHDVVSQRGLSVTVLDDLLTLFDQGSAMTLKEMTNQVLSFLHKHAGFTHELLVYMQMLQYRVETLKILQIICAGAMQPRPRSHSQENEDDFLEVIERVSCSNHQDGGSDDLTTIPYLLQNHLYDSQVEDLLNHFIMFAINLLDEIHDKLLFTAGRTRSSSSASSGTSSMTSSCASSYRTLDMKQHQQQHQLSRFHGVSVDIRPFLMDLKKIVNEMVLISEQLHHHYL